LPLRSVGHITLFVRVSGSTLAACSCSVGLPPLGQVKNSPAPPGMATQQQLEAWFAAVDKDGSGAINVAELQQCLAQSGLNFSMKCAAALPVSQLRL